jgi:hypothetical protein
LKSEKEYLETNNNDYKKMHYGEIYKVWKLPDYTMHLKKSG